MAVPALSRSFPEISTGGGGMPCVRPVAGAEPCPQWQFGDAWRTCPPVPCPLQSGLALPSRSAPHVQVTPGKHPPVPLAYGAFGKRGEETRHRIKSRGLMFYPCCPFPAYAWGCLPGTQPRGPSPSACGIRPLSFPHWTIPLLNCTWLYPQRFSPSSGDRAAGGEGAFGPLGPGWKGLSLQIKLWGQRGPIPLPAHPISLRDPMGL